MGSPNLTDTGLITLDTGNGPINPGAKLRDLTRRGWSRVYRKTLWFTGPTGDQASSSCLVSSRCFQEALEPIVRTPETGEADIHTQSRNGEIPVEALGSVIRAYSIQNNTLDQTP